MMEWHDNLKETLTAATPGATADNADLHAKMDAANGLALIAPAVFPVHLSLRDGNLF